MNQVRKFLREVALNVSRLTEEIADKLEDKEKQPRTETNEKEETATTKEEATVEATETSTGEEVVPEKKEEVSSVETSTENAKDDDFKNLNDSPEESSEVSKTKLNEEHSFLIDGEDYVEKAEEKKHDIEYMKKCCQLELQKMKEKNEVPAPFYFDRVAILSKKDKNYVQEVRYCEDYIKAVDEFYANNKDSNVADVRKSTKYHSLVKRMEKAKSLISKD